MYQTTSIMKAKAILETLFVIGFWEHSNFCMLCTSTVTGATLRGIYIERSYSPATLKRLRHCKAAAVQIMLTINASFRTPNSPLSWKFMCHLHPPEDFPPYSRLVRLSSSISFLLRSTGSSRTSMPGPTGLALRVAGKTYEERGSAKFNSAFWSESYRSVSNNQSLGSSLSRPIMDSSISSFLFHWDITHLCATPT